MAEPISLLLVDDHRVVRMGLKTFFSTLPDIQVVGEASNGKSAVEMVTQLAPE